jgi:hypothetical protein
LAGEDPLHRLDGDPGALPELDGERRELVVVADALEQFVVEVPPEPGERRAEGRLAEPEPGGGTGDVGLLEEGLEGAPT